MIGIFLALFLLFTIGPVILTIYNIFFTVTNQKNVVFETVLYISGMLLSALLLTQSGMPEYAKPLIRSQSPFAHEFLSRNSSSSIYFLFFVGVASYFILKFGREPLPPLTEVLAMAGAYIGCAVSLVILIHASGGLEGGREGGSSLFFFTFFVSLLPFNYLLSAAVLLVRHIRRTGTEERDYGSGFLSRVNAFLIKTQKKGWISLLCILPILLACLGILHLFGQSPDSVIQAFTQTSDWRLSAQISPPPVEYPGHYLCTVSLRGHRKLVKPLRYGLRRGHRIVVNRQLCVANAFEEFIAEQAPGFHRAVRACYDRYGYPLSKRINSPWTADAVYLLMKPLEWLFVVTLYLFDPKPEHRIAGQYLPPADIPPNSRRG